MMHAHYHDSGYGVALLLVLYVSSIAIRIGIIMKIMISKTNNIILS